MPNSVGCKMPAIRPSCVIVLVLSGLLAGGWLCHAEEEEAPEGDLYDSADALLNGQHYPEAVEAWQ